VHKHTKLKQSKEALRSLFNNPFIIRNLGAFFAANAAKNRAFRDSAIAPAPALRAGAASHPSNPLRAHQRRGSSKSEFLPRSFLTYQSSKNQWSKK
jgi:hypothetical protein